MKPANKQTIGKWYHGFSIFASYCIEMSILLSWTQQRYYKSK